MRHKMELKAISICHVAELKANLFQYVPKTPIYKILLFAELARRPTQSRGKPGKGTIFTNG